MIIGYVLYSPQKKEYYDDESESFRPIYESGQHGGLIDAEEMGRATVFRDPMQVEQLLSQDRYFREACSMRQVELVEITFDGKIEKEPVLGTPKRKLR